MDSLNFLESLHPHPITQLEHWIKDAEAAECLDAIAMTLATSCRDVPSARVVLLRGLDARGLSFYTNYQSRKGHDLRCNARAAALLFWPRIQRQVRVEGTIAPLPAAESDTYFASRPRGHQLGAWASEQSRPLDSRATLERREQEVMRRFGDGVIPRPPHWGGYLLTPLMIEFWQQRDSRLHDRVQYVRPEADAPWTRGWVNP